MRMLQYAGLAISLLIAGYVFWKYKQGRYGRSHFRWWYIPLIAAAGRL